MDAHCINMYLSSSWALQVSQVPNRHHSFGNRHNKGVKWKICQPSIDPRILNFKSWSTQFCKVSHRPPTVLPLSGSPGHPQGTFKGRAKGGIVPWVDAQRAQEPQAFSAQVNPGAQSFPTMAQCPTKTAWWLTYPSEKYEFVSWDYDIPNIWKVI